MIGQHELWQKFNALVEHNKFPRFAILIGDKGSGRKTLIQQTLKPLGDYQLCDISADGVRAVIEQAYTQITPTVYVFADADTMSTAAKNALLKVTEEPPNNAYFVMTLASKDNALPTIVSRASVFYMWTYTPSELLEYYHRRAHGDEEIITQYCHVPGDIDLLCSYNIKEFRDFVLMVLDNIHLVSGANVFKIASRLNLSGTDNDKYDLMLFWSAFSAECLNRLADNPLQYVSGVRLTSHHMYKLGVAGINAQFCFDVWLLDIRKRWFEYADDCS